MYAPLKTIYKIIFKPFPYFVLAEDYNKVPESTVCLKRLFPASFLQNIPEIACSSPHPNAATSALYISMV